MIQRSLFDDPLLAPDPPPGAADDPADDPADGGDLPTIVPRPYQVRAADLAEEAWAEANSALLVMATGAGKTVVAGLVARRACEAGLDTLFVAHREELLRQAAWTLRCMTGTRVEREGQDEFSCQEPGRRPRVVVASKDTLHRWFRLKRFDPRRFGRIIVDEAHHGIRANKSYAQILDYFEGYKLLGITASPDRGDGVGLDSVYNVCCYVYDLADAIEDGYLVRINQRLALIAGYDLSQVKATKGDLSEREVADVMRRDKVLHGVADAAVQYATRDVDRANEGLPGRPTIVFCASVQHARAVADILNSKHARFGTGAAAAIWSQAKDAPKMDPAQRREVLERYARGEIRYLTNYGVLTEGVDLPGTTVVLIARPTRQRGLYAQMLGRGTRPDPSVRARIDAAADAAERRAVLAASRKPAVVVVDLVGSSGRHKLVTAADVLAGRFSPGVVEAVKKESQRRQGTPDLYAALAAARAEQDAQEARRRQVQISVSLVEQPVDPFDPRDRPSPDREPGWDKGRKPSRGQRKILERHGFSTRQIDELSHRDAKGWISEIRRRHKAGLSTLRQDRILARFGVEAGGPISFRAASAVIDRLAALGWPPGGLPESEVATIVGRFPCETN